MHEEALGSDLDPEDEAPETQAALARLDRRIRLLTDFLESTAFPTLRASRPELRGERPTDVRLRRDARGQVGVETTPQAGK